ncbi:MAG: hypothetical protein LC748_14675, partial [Thermomicrobia bacterium]|nr:hypothetical protein [Thermomicrobia bacterium]
MTEALAARNGVSSYGENIMDNSLRRVTDKYMGHAMFPAGMIITLPIREALLFCQDLREMQVGMIGLETW